MLTAVLPAPARSGADAHRASPAGSAPGPRAGRGRLRGAEAASRCASTPAPPGWGQRVAAGPRGGRGRGSPGAAGCFRRRGTRRMAGARPPSPFRSPAISAGVSERNSPGSRPFVVTGPERHAAQLRDRVPDRLEQPLHLVLLALVQGHLHPGVVLRLDDPRAVDGHEVAFHPDAALEPLEGLGVRHPVHLGVVDARHLVARVRDALREGPVVGQEDEALGGHVEPSHREEPGHLRHEGHDRGPALGVLARGDDAAGLVEDQVDERLGGLDPDPVHPHVVALEVRLRAQLAHDLAVDHDPALEHQLLGPAPRGEARPRQDLL